MLWTKGSYLTNCIFWNQIWPNPGQNYGYARSRMGKPVIKLTSFISSGKRPFWTRFSTALSTFTLFAFFARSRFFQTYSFRILIDNNKIFHLKQKSTHQWTKIRTKLDFSKKKSGSVTFFAFMDLANLKNIRHIL